MLLLKKHTSAGTEALVALFWLAESYLAFYRCPVALIQFCKMVSYSLQTSAFEAECTKYVYAFTSCLAGLIYSQGDIFV